MREPLDYGNLSDRQLIDFVLFTKECGGTPPKALLQEVAERDFIDYENLLAAVEGLPESEN